MSIGANETAARGWRSDADVRGWLAAMTRSERLVFATTFVLAGTGSLLLTLYAGLHNSPRASLFTSGVSLFPSPLGTALGTVGGVAALATLQALAIGSIAVAIVALRVPFRVIVVALPVLVWAAPLSMNVVAGALFAWGWIQARERWYWLAAGFHLSVLALIVACSRARWIALGALVVGVGVLVATPYRAGLGLGDELERLPQALLGGVVVAFFALLPGLVAGVPVWKGTFLAFGIALALAAAYTVHYDLSDGYVLWTTVPQTMRYGLPVVFVCFVEAATLAGGGRPIRVRLGAVR